MPTPTTYPLIEDDVIAYLASQGFGTLGTDLFREMLPDDEHGPATCTAVRSTGGVAPTLYVGGVPQRSTLQVTHRNAVLTTGKKWVNALIEFFRDPTRQNGLDLTNYHIWLLRPLNQEPTVETRDQEHRYFWTVSLECSFYRK